MNSSLKINGDIRENVLVKLIGGTDISSIGSTVTGAISNLDTKIVQMKNDINNSIKTQLNQMDTKLTEVSTSLNSTITNKIKPIENKIGTSNYSGVGSTISQSLVNLKNSINTCNSNINSLPLKIYPVGAIYISTSSTNPSVLFGGSWQQITGRFLLACGGGYGAGAVGGEASHVLSYNEMPLHTHSLGNHTHSIPSLSGNTKDGGYHGHNILPVNGGCNWVMPASIGTGETFRPTSSPFPGVHQGHWFTDILAAAPSGTHSHEVVTNGSTTGANNGATGPSGVNYAHNNMPPYLAVYVWKRIS